MKKVIYTVVCGQYDLIKPIKHHNNDIDYICFTDDSYSGVIPKPWIHRIAKKDNLRGKELNRFYKINSIDILPEYDYSLYIDGNIEILRDPFDYFLQSIGDDVIGMYSHYCRSNIYEEGVVCAKLGLVYQWELVKQIRTYTNNGFRSDSLFEANVIFRKHDERLRKALNFWWMEYFNGVKRDQISFTYAMEMNNINVKSFGKSDVRFTNHYFKINHHKHSKLLSVKKRLVSYMNKVTSLVNKNDF